MFMAVLININSLLYTFFILPMRAGWGFTKSFWGWAKHKRLRFDMYFFSIILIVSLIFTLTADISVIYHWVKGKAFIKLLTLYVILEMSDLLARNVGKDLIYSLARDVYYRRNCMKMVFLLWIYTLFHSYILLVQMLTLNSVFKSSKDTFFLFLLSNNFTEIKIYVFKKTDWTKLYDIGTRDICERVQQYMYITYILFSNYLDQWTITTLVLFCLTEFIVDWIKNFFFNNDNAHDPSIYLSHRYLLWRIFTDWRQKRIAREAPDDEKLEEDRENEDILKDLHTDLREFKGYSSQKGFIEQWNKIKDVLCKGKARDMTLLRYTLNEYYHSSIFQNFMILPQTCLILRLFESIIREKEFLLDEIFIIVVWVVCIGIVFECILSNIIKSISKNVTKITR